MLILILKGLKMNATILFSQIQNKLPTTIGKFRKSFIKYMVQEPIMSNEDLLKRLENLSETELNEVAKMLEKDKLDSPALCFWFYNLLLGGYGVAWFKINIFSIGCIKLILLLITLIFELDILLVPLSGWSVLDLFIIGAILRNKNLEKVNNFIDLAKVRNEKNNN